MNTHFTKTLVFALGLAVFASCQPATSTQTDSQAISVIDKDVYLSLIHI